MAPHTLNTPAINEYSGTTFRSQLEARRAAFFDQHRIAWQYELVCFSGWTPDFRLVLNGVQACAEVKPVSEFPMDVAQRVLNAGWTGDIPILGRGQATPDVTMAMVGPRWTWPRESRRP